MRKSYLTLLALAASGFATALPREARAGDDTPPLSVKDHTLIVQAIMDHHQAVLAQIDVKKHLQNKTHPSGKEVLEAALQVDKIDPGTKARIREVLKGLPALRKAGQHVPDGDKKVIAEIADHLKKARSAPEVLEILRGLRKANTEAKRETLAAGIDGAILLVEDGAATIYSPNAEFYQALLRNGKGAAPDGVAALLRDVKTEDILGFLEGYRTGGFLGGIMEANSRSNEALIRLMRLKGWL